MTITTTLPTSGQFVAFWTYNNLPWSSTLRYDSRGRLEEYKEECEDPSNLSIIEDHWELSSKDRGFFSTVNAQYYIP